MTIKKGDYFLLPYAGPRRERLVRAVSQWCEDYWRCRHGRTYHIAYLGSCTRVSPSLAKRILGK